MAWKPTRTLQNTGSISAVALDTVPWVLRDSRCIYGVDIARQKIQWQKELNGDLTLGAKSFVTSNDLAIVSAHRNRERRHIWLFAISLQTGALVWKRKVDWDMANNLGGLNVSNNLVIFMENSNDPHLVFIDATTGTTLLSTAGIKAKSTGPLKNSPRSSTVAGGYVYFCHRVSGLYRAKIDQKESTLVKVYEDKAVIVMSSGDQVYALLSNIPPAVVWLDGATGEERGRLLLHEDIKVANLVASAAVPGRIALLLGKGGGIALADFNSGALLSARTRLTFDDHLLWHVGQDEGWYVTAAVWTPAGIVTVAKIKDGRFVSCLDEATGKELPAPEIHPGFLKNMVYWSGENLLLNTSRGLQIFRWQAETEPE